MEPIIFVLTTVTVLYFIVRASEARNFKDELTFKSCDVLSDYIASLPDNRDTTLEEEQQYDKMHAIWMSIESISYYRLLFSFKPLKEEFWLNEEQLKFLGL